MLENNLTYNNSSKVRLVGLWKFKRAENGLEALSCSRMMNYSDYDSDGYSSNEDADYVPSGEDNVRLQRCPG